MAFKGEQIIVEKATIIALFHPLYCQRSTLCTIQMHIVTMETTAYCLIAKSWMHQIYYPWLNSLHENANQLNFFGIAHPIIQPHTCTFLHNWVCMYSLPLQQYSVTGWHTWHLAEQHRWKSEEQMWPYWYPVGCSQDWQHFHWGLLSRDWKQSPPHREGQTGLPGNAPPLQEHGPEDRIGAKPTLYSKEDKSRFEVNTGNMMPLQPHPIQISVGVPGTVLESML